MENRDCMNFSENYFRDLTKDLDDYAYEKIYDYLREIKGKENDIIELECKLKYEEKNSEKYQQIEENIKNSKEELDQLTDKFSGFLQSIASTDNTTNIINGIRPNYLNYFRVDEGKSTVGTNKGSMVNNMVKVNSPINSNNSKTDNHLPCDKNTNGNDVTISKQTFV